jgi:uncharacterized protein YycO
MDKYEPILGDFGIIKSRGIAARLIQIGTVSRWNHAFIYIGEGRIIEAKPTGVVLSHVTDYPKIAWNKHEGLNYTQRLAIVGHAYNQVGKPYNFLVIGNIALRILGLRILANTKLMYNLAQKNGYICSELVAESYAVAGVPLSDKASDLVTPGDLAERLIYQ